MHSPGINGEGELMGQPANPGSPGKMVIKNGLYVCAFTLQAFNKKQMQDQDVQKPLATALITLA